MSISFLRDSEYARKNAKMLPQWKRPKRDYIGAENSVPVRRTIKFNNNKLEQKTSHLNVETHRYQWQWYKRREQVWINHFYSLFI